MRATIASKHLSFPALALSAYPIVISECA